MVDVNALVAYLKEGIKLIQPSIPTIVGAILTSVFLRKDTQTSEFVKIKNGLFQEAAEELLENGRMTYYEFYKCKNFLEVAALADKYFNEKKESVSQRILDFDWFIRFYESSGSISSEEMQKYWAKLLVNAVNNNHIENKIYIDILGKLSYLEAKIIEKIYNYPFDVLQHKTLLTYNLPNSIEIQDDKKNDEFPALNSFEIELTLINLSRLGCISLGKSWGGGEFNSLIHVTLLGKYFYEACNT